jgi:hypothetical protein
VSSFAKGLLDMSEYFADIHDCSPQSNLGSYGARNVRPDVARMSPPTLRSAPVQRSPLDTIDNELKRKQDPDQNNGPGKHLGDRKHFLCND